MDQVKLVTAGRDDISLSPSTKIRELEHLNNLMKKRIEEVCSRNMLRFSMVNQVVLKYAKL